MVDHLLLDRRQLAQLELDAEVPAGDHHRAGDLEDLPQLADRLHLLELGDHWRGAPEAGDVVTAFDHVLRLAYKGQRHIVDAKLDRQLEVGEVFVCEGR